jgi:hypothetical protein
VYGGRQQLNKNSNFVRRKVGRPAATVETVQVGLRLPKAWVEQFQKGGGVSKEIQERLFRSFFEDGLDPRVIQLRGQIEELARAVERTFRAPWHADRKAHQAFIDVLRRLLADMPEPSQQISTLKADALTAGEVIYSRYVDEVREWNEKQILEQGDDKKA